MMRVKRFSASRSNYAILVCAFSFPLTAMLTGCSRESGATAPSPPLQIESARDPNLVQVSHPDRFPLVRAISRQEPDRLQANGVVAPDVSRTVHINSLSGGRVVDIRTKLGDDVAQGQVLLVIHSPELAAAIADYQKSQADERLARQSLERAHSLYSHGALAQKDVQQTEDEEDKAKVDLHTAAEHIQILGGDLDRLSPIIQVKSPASGTVVEQNTSGGEAVRSVDSSPSLFTIANLLRVWVLCDIYENSLAEVRLGDRAEIRLSGYPDRPFSGKVSNISRVLDASSRTAKVRVDLDNYLGLLRPGMFATVTFVSQAKHARMLVPASSILRLHDKDWVFKPAGPGLFRRTAVQGGPTTADGFEEILSGLTRDDEVVRNALLFSSEAEQQAGPGS